MEEKDKIKLKDYPHVFSVSEPKIIYRSKIHVSKVLTILSDKHYNWFQKFMCKAFFNVKVENINMEKK